MKKRRSNKFNALLMWTAVILALVVGTYVIVSVMIGSDGLFVGNFLKISERMWHMILFLLCFLDGMLFVFWIVGRSAENRTKKLARAAKRAIDTVSETQAERRAQANARDLQLSVGASGDGVRFFRLCAIDEAEEREPDYREDVDLCKLCEDFRNYAASKKGLYYDIKTVRSFVAGLAVSRLVIFQGMSGTGKTSLACAFGDFLKNPSVLIPVQPSWKEKTDLVGYFNEFTKNYNETELLARIYEAGGNRKMYVTVLDEMNIARVEYYFAEFLSVLEMPDPERRLIEIVSDSLPNDPKRIIDGKIKLPENMWYVGTANNDDSTMAISDKVYDRAMIIDLDRRALPFDAPETEPYAVSYDKLAALVTSAKRRYGLTLRNRRRIERLDAYLIENLGITFGNRIMRQIESYVPVYVACGGSELEAIDTVLAKKVLRKLESKNPVYVRNAASALSLYLDELFSEGSMPVCRAMLAKFDSQK